MSEGFDLLHPVVQHHIVNSLGWSELRALQVAAIRPLLDGEDVLLLAPTAGGKTEAALFPLLSRMAEHGWRGTSVLYICPLRALLNNLEPRIASYTGWLGRTAGLRHGDTGRSERQRIAVDHPDVLLTTPESLEAMLVSQTIDPRILLADVRAGVVDEIHAFAGDDRGWHLLAVLERVAQLTGRPLQRVGLSATVGNADELLHWFQGSGRGERAGQVVNPPTSTTTAPDLQLDYVGSTANAAKVIAALHLGEKRLVFADNRSTVEELASHLRALGTETYVSHSSLAASERRRAEQAFAEARNCVNVSTSTLELGIDVGDLDRVIQIGAPSKVASLLQRLGRTGRRPGTTRSLLFLATSDEELLRAAALLLLWSEGYVEPIQPPPQPRHVLAQQLLAMALQNGRVGQRTWSQPLAALSMASADETRDIAAWMLRRGHLDEDSGMLFVGPEAERVYGRRHFMEVLSMFTSSPEFTIVHGRREIGHVDPYVLIRKVEGPRVLALDGQGWLVTTVDWPRRRAYVEPSDIRGAARWVSLTQPASFPLVQAERRVVLRAELPGVTLSTRAVGRLPAARTEHSGRVDDACTVVATIDGRTRWWTWAGGRANAVLTAALESVDASLIDDEHIYDNRQIGLRTHVGASDLRRAVHAVADKLRFNLTSVTPFVTDRALKQLKFSDLLPPELARATLEARLSDQQGALAILAQPIAHSTG